MAAYNQNSIAKEAASAYQHDAIFLLESALLAPHPMEIWMNFRNVVLAAFILATPLSAAQPSYSVTGSIPAADGGWDYSSVDPETHQLFIGRTDSVTAVDLATGKVTDKLVSAQRAHSVMPIPGSGAFLETDGGTNSVRLIDARTGAVRWSLPTGEKPDGALWDGTKKRAIVMHNKGGTIALIDVMNAKVTATLAVAPGLEGAAIDKHGLFWVNSEETNKLIPIDLDAMKVLAPVILPDCDGATGLVYSQKHDQLLSVCGSGYAYVVDTKTHSVVARYEIGKGADAAIIDEARATVAVPCSDGTLYFFDLSQAAITPAGSIATEKGARSGAVDPATGTLYLPTARFQPATKPGEHRVLIPGSFHVLVVSLKR